MADRTRVHAQLAGLFRERGYAATSLPDITAATGLGRGSLYHLFPGGKPQMLAEVVAGVAAWFEQEVFEPLEGAAPDVDAMLDAVSAYFDSGRSLCLIGRLGLEPHPTGLDAALRQYFARWQDTLGTALRTLGHAEPDAAAEELVVAVQGALVVAHTRGEPQVFTRAITGWRAHLSG